LSIVSLLGLLFADVVTGRALASLASPGALGIQITGYQWWWDIQYLDSDPSLRVTTANELHLPVGRPIYVTLRAADVIHSFWVPPLHGKTDLVPGRENVTWLQVDRPGIYRGQCAEFCGVQHAHMGLVVVAQPEAAFRRWLAQQSRPAAPAQSAQAQRGQQIFMDGTCSSCHTIRGTDANGYVGPDLTHVASRNTLGALTVLNRPDTLAEWIRDSQHLKPGNQMPAFHIGPTRIQELTAYLEELK
jgi:cytochrome c oxidase subunit 2